MEYKNQHFVTEAYLRAWCDPNTPEGHEPYVWIVSKADRKIGHKSPKNIFSETNFYTVYDSQGNRILELEHKLREVEDKFILLRDKKLQKHLPLLPDDRKTIALFVSTMFARTKFQKTMQVDVWQELLDAIDETPEGDSNFLKGTELYKQIKMLQEQPMPFHMFNFVNIAMPVLLRMNCVVYETNTKPGFITSDNPCFWVDPARFYPNEPTTWFGLGSSKLEITLPITPEQTICLRRGGPDGYSLVHPDPQQEEEMVDLMNGFIAGASEEILVINQNIFKERWLSDTTI
ncbi:MAG: DUF4238 domain-containing protein [Anaerolineales bacterium]